MNNKIAVHCRKLKENGQIYKTNSRDGVIHITGSNIRDGKVIKILHMSILLDIFPDFDLVLMPEKKRIMIHCNQATEFRYIITCILLCFSVQRRMSVQGYHRIFDGAIFDKI